MRIGTGGALTVTATELWQAELRAGRGFGRGGFSNSALGLNSLVQLLNPVGSGVQVIVRDVIVSITAQATVELLTYDVALVTDAGAGVNLLLGGAAGQAHVRTDQLAAIPGVLIYRAFVLAQTPLHITLEWLAELSPGRGMIVTTDAQNIAVAVSYMWREV